MKAQSLTFKFMLIMIQQRCVNSFLPELVNQKVHRRNTSHGLHSFGPSFALTERQMQFWEDVEEGLDEIESYFQKQGEKLERIRNFVKRYCRNGGMVPPRPAADHCNDWEAYSVGTGILKENDLHNSTLAVPLNSAKGEIPPPSWDPSICHEPSEENVYGLRAQPFWEPDMFPWARDLEKGSQHIIDEYNSILEQGKGGCFAGDSAWQNQVMGKGWSAIRLQRLGEWKADVCSQFPATYSLLRSLPIPFAVRGVCFARQASHSGVQAHSDGRNFILTAHLGLKVPNGCWLQVGKVSNKREWKEGKLTILDTSFSHSTGNPTSEERHVLIVDFWHPDLTAAEIAALTFVYNLRNKFESGGVPQRKPRSSGLAQPAKLMWWQKITS